MRGNNVLGVIFSNMHDEAIRELTDLRTMGSVPFGGRYRLIDFALSNMTNSGITKVGVVTKSNYRSLLDHVGSGKAWDLSRKTEGLILLPPYESGGSDRGVYGNRMEALLGIRGFLEHAQEDYVFISDTDVVCNLNVEKVVERHIDTGADVTVVYKKGKISPVNSSVTVVETDGDGMVEQVILEEKMVEEQNVDLNMYVVGRKFLLGLLSEAASRGWRNFNRDLLQANVGRYKIAGYEFTGYCGIINSMSNYFRVNMDLLDPECRGQLFLSNRPVYTKVKDNMPTRYGLGSEVKNSLIADGCVIEGKVENCILFRGVHVAKGAEISNSIIMQGSQVGEGTRLNYVILDKNVTLRSDRTLMGFDPYPVYIRKGSMV